MPNRRRAALITAALLITLLAGAIGFMIGRGHSPSPVASGVKASPSASAINPTGEVIVPVDTKTITGAPTYRCASDQADNLYRSDNNVSVRGAWVSTYLMPDKPVFHLAWNRTPGMIVDVRYTAKDGKLRFHEFPIITSDHQITKSHMSLKQPGQPSDHLRHTFDIDLAAKLPGWDGNLDDVDVITDICPYASQPS